jgi:hypothetical protein
MLTLSKRILAGLAASLLLGLGVGSATADTLSFSNVKFRITWAALNLHDGAEISVRCPVTFEGSFHSSTIRKRTGLLIGFITRAVVNGTSPPCTGGRVTILRETLPWHMTYEDFVGVLPRIEAVVLLLRKYAYRVEVTILGFRIACLYKDQNRPEENLIGLLEVSTATGRIGRYVPGVGRYSSLFSGSELCPRRGFWEGEGEVFLLGSSTTRITLTLI